MNSFLYPKDNKIKTIKYNSREIPGDITKYPQPLSLHSLDSIRVDVLCKCIMEKDNEDKKYKDENNKDGKNEDEENEIDDNEYEYEYEEEDNEDEDEKDENEDEEDENFENNKIIIIDLEIQIGFNVENTKSFLTYAKKLEKKYEKDIIVLSLVYKVFAFPKAGKGSITSIKEKIISDYKKLIHLMIILFTRLLRYLPQSSKKRRRFMDNK